MKYNYIIKVDVCETQMPPVATKSKIAVMSKSVRLKDLTDKISFGLTHNINISAAYFIVRTDKIFKIS